MAVEINCNVEGFEEFKMAMERFDSTMQEHVHKLLAGWAEEAKAYAKQLAPVRTGRLRSSIYAKIQDWVAQIGAEATYALFVEFGTRNMQARPFLYPAIQEYLPRLEQIICEAIDTAKAEAGLQ
ncbi:MAG: HK97 gp10 family phage protein [Candidatus Bathyarchaeota archaeon]|nr:HK97 gp10 family phage protein [Candidatus Bathyarchaeota archaeon]